MEDLTESETSIAWLWVIEAMASYQEVSLSLLHDLLQAAPELPCKFAKNAKERIALRCLEDLCRRARDNQSLQGSKVEFELSESCENVLQHIVQETPESDLKSGGPELAKYDILSFVTHKKSHIPKLALEKLRDSILDGSHQYADFLREKSGLESTSRDDKKRNSVIRRPNLTRCDVESKRVETSSVPPIIENNGERSEGNLRNGDVSPSKRVRSDFDDEDRSGELGNYDGVDDSDAQNVNRKKAKLHESSDTRTFEQILIPLCEKEPEKVSIERSDIGTAEEDREGVSNECTVSKRSCDNNDNNEFHENRPEREDMVLEGGSNDCTDSKRSCENNDNDELHENEPEIQGRVLEGGSNDCTVSNSSRENNDKNEFHEDEPESPREKTTILTPDGSKGDEENRAEPSRVPSTETEHKSSAEEEPETPDERTLRFQEPNSEKTSIASEENKISSDSDGFHDERTDVAKKKHEFLSSQQQLADGPDSFVADFSEQNICMKCSGPAGQALVCSGNNCQVVVHEKCLGSSVIFDDKGDFHCPFCSYSLAIAEYLEAKKQSSLSRKNLSAFIRRGSVEHRTIKKSPRLNKKKKHQKGLIKDKNVELEKRAEEEEKERNQVANNVNEEESDRELRNIIVENQQTYSEREKGENVIAIEKSPQNEVPSTDTDHPVIKTEEDFMKQKHVDAPKQLAREFSLDSSEDGDDDYETSIINYCISVRKRETHHKTYPAKPQFRRICPPWTAEEEQKIKEGVEYFSDERKIPWKKILEFGATVFKEGRKTGDLKDKWRNMSKSSSSKRPL